MRENGCKGPEEASISAAGEFSCGKSGTPEELNMEQELRSRACGGGWVCGRPAGAVCRHFLPFSAVQPLHRASAAADRACIVEIHEAMIGQGLCGDGVIDTRGAQEPPGGGGGSVGAGEQKVPVEPWEIMPQYGPAVRGYRYCWGCRRQVHGSGAAMAGVAEAVVVQIVRRPETSTSPRARRRRASG